MKAPCFTLKSLPGLYTSSLLCRLEGECLGCSLGRSRSLPDPERKCLLQSCVLGTSLVSLHPQPPSLVFMNAQPTGGVARLLSTLYPAGPPLNCLHPLSHHLTAHFSNGIRYSPVILALQPGECWEARPTQALPASCPCNISIHPKLATFWLLKCHPPASEDRPSQTS